MEIENMRTTIEQKVLEMTSIADRVLEMFIMYYGDDRIDSNINDVRELIVSSVIISCKTQNDFDCNETELSKLIDSEIKTYEYFIIKIHWPEITIQNERKNTIKIYDLFCDVKASMSTGKLNDLSFKRSTFTKEQLCSGYVHSHLKAKDSIYGKIRKEDYEEIAERYMSGQSFCFGSGPIRNTLNKLMSSVEIDLYDYSLLCRELDICVGIESLAGGPYTRMSYVTENEVAYNINGVTEYNSLYDSEKEFVAYFLGNSDLNFIFDENKYDIGCSDVDFAIYATKMYFDFIRKNADHVSNIDMRSSLCDVVRRNGDFHVKKLIFDNNEFFEWINSNNITITIFKGKPCCLRILEEKEVEEHKPKMKLLRQEVVSFLKQIVFSMINSNIETNGNNAAEESKDEHEKMLYRFVV